MQERYRTFGFTLRDIIIRTTSLIMCFPFTLEFSKVHCIHQWPLVFFFNEFEIIFLSRLEWNIYLRGIGVFQARLRKSLLLRYFLLVVLTVIIAELFSCLMFWTWNKKKMLKLSKKLFINYFNFGFWDIWLFWLIYQNWYAQTLVHVFSWTEENGHALATPFCAASARV